jgi:hypothetical protein
MPTSTRDLLASKTIIKAISQIQSPGTTLQRLFGWGFGGANKRRQSGRNFSYDIVNTARSVATARLPAQASARITAQNVGHTTGVFPRAAETIALHDEVLLNQCRVGGPLDVLDNEGEVFITRQEAYLAQRFSNLIEFQTAAMLRGSYSFTSVGDELRHGFSGGETTVEFKIPAGNLGQLDMLGDGEILNFDWNSPSGNIPGSLYEINQAMVQLTGMGLSHVVVNSSVWQMLLANEAIREIGGASQVTFDTLRRNGAGEFTAVLRAIPWVTFHIVDYGLTIWDGSAETYTRLIGDQHAAFLPEPSARWVQYLEGSEIVTEGPGGTRAERYGFYPFAYAVHDPSGWELSAVMNGLPALYTPTAIAYGQVSGGSY